MFSMWIKKYLKNTFFSNKNFLIVDKNLRMYINYLA